MQSDFRKYEQEIIEKWGDSPQYEEYKQKANSTSDEKFETAANELNKILREFADALKNGDTCCSVQSQSLVEKLKNCISENYYTCDNKVLCMLGQMYVCDERFRNNIDKNGNGTAQFIHDAIVIFCDK